MSSKNTLEVYALKAEKSKWSIRASLIVVVVYIISTMLRYKKQAGELAEPLNSFYPYFSALADISIASLFLFYGYIYYLKKQKLKAAFYLFFSGSIFSILIFN